MKLLQSLLSPWQVITLLQPCAALGTGCQPKGLKQGLIDGWVTAAYRHCTPKCTFKGGFKAEFQSWALASGVITVPVTRAGSSLGGWGYHTCWFVTEERTRLHLSLGFSPGCPQIIKAEPAVPFSCLGKEVSLAARLISGNNRKRRRLQHISLFSVLSRWCILSPN